MNQEESKETSENIDLEKILEEVQAFVYTINSLGTQLISGDQTGEVKTYYEKLEEWTIEFEDLYNKFVTSSYLTRNQLEIVLSYGKKDAGVLF